MLSQPGIKRRRETGRRSCEQPLIKGESWLTYIEQSRSRTFDVCGCRARRPRPALTGLNGLLSASRPGPSAPTQDEGE